MSNNPTSILASFATMKNLVDAQQYQSPYQILAKFIQYIIIKCNLHSFTAVEMKNRLFEVFGFDVPEAVVRSAARGLQFIRTENSIYHVNHVELKDNATFKEIKTVAEANNSDIIDLLIAFAQETDPASTIWTDALTQEFIAYLLDDQQTTTEGKYTDLIGQFILKNESDEKIQSALTAIREGSILYIGLNHNINETGSLRKPLTLFLGTEVLFSLYGYNGDIYKQLAQDLYNQIKAANAGAKRITLRYFSDVKKEIEDFFTSAELIVDGKKLLFDTVAMKAIINGCSTSGDVKVKKADFYHVLQYSYGIIEDDRESYYEDTDDQYNLESLSADPQQYDSIRLISHINKLRKGHVFPYDLDAEYLIVTNSGNTLRISREQVERVMSEQAIDCACNYAVSVERLTNILWYKLGNGLGRREYPTNVNAVLKARMLLASKISQSVSKLYMETRAQYRAGVITEDQLASRIITLRKKPIIPEELTAETIEDSLDFSLEYLTRYEEEVNRNKEALQEKENLLQAISDQKDRVISEKDDALAEKEQQIQDQLDRNAELEAELAEYHRIDKEKEEKRIKRKKTVHLILSIIWKLAALAVLVALAAWICSKINVALTSAVGIVVGLIGAIPVVASFVKDDLKKYHSKTKHGDTEESTIEH